MSTAPSHLLLLGDCFDHMRSLPDHSIDMILCDLPYGTTECRWDVVLPFEPLWEEYWRLIKPNGAVVLFGSEPFSTKLRANQLKYFKYDWIWLKNRPTGFLHAKNMPLKKHEIISVFSKGSVGHPHRLTNRVTYNPQNLVECNKEIKGALKKFGSTIGHRPSVKDNYVKKHENYPTSILEYEVDLNGERYHPTQKPVPLLEYLVKTYTFENETVLDNCMGAGSTGVACFNTNRRFIGIEKDEEYFAVAQKRLMYQAA